MKKLLFIIFVSGTLLGMSSCSNDLQGTSSNVLQIEDTEFTNLLKSLDQVGQPYAAPETRGSGWTKWGGRIFAATVDGITGYISGPAGWAVGPLCSWAFEEHWARCNRLMETTPSNRRIMGSDLGSMELLTYVNCINVPNKEDSIGYYHNLILRDLANSGKSYETTNGDVDYQAILNDCMEATKKYGVDLHISKPDQQKLCSFSKDVVETFTSIDQKKNTLNDAFRKMNNSYITIFGTKSNIGKVEAVQNKIINVLNDMDDEESVKDYADQVYELLDKTNVSSELKTDLKTVTSVTVNSKLYWTTNENRITK